MAKGKRAGARPRRGFRADLALLALGVTLAVVAWGYLVFAAIDFGTSARGGDSAAWGFLALAAVGAVACLFVGLMLLARLLRALGIISGPPPAGGGDEAPADASAPPVEPEAPRPSDGRHAG